jgi:hypothetical protein
MEQKTTPLAPAIELDLSPNPGRVRFETLEALEAWTNAESSAWNNFYQKMKEAPFPQPLYEAQRSPIVKLTNVINGARQNIAQKQNWLPNFLTSVRSELEAYRTRSTYPFRPQSVHSTSPAGLRILDAGERGDRTAIGMLAWEIGMRFLLPAEAGKIDSTSMIDGILLARLQHLGFDKSVESEREGLRQLSAEWNTLVAEDRALYEAARVDVDDHANRYDTRFKTIARAALTVLRKQRDDHATEMRTIRATFREDMKLRAPVEYWEAKRIRHTKLAQNFAFASSALVVGAVLAVVVGALPAFEYITSREATAPTTAGSVYLAHLKVLVVMGVPIFSGFWILRVLSRLFHMNVGAMADADERTTMVRTYLALFDEKKLSEQDRILILQALFRPTTQTPDDSPPPNWFDLLMQRIKPSG